MSMPAVPRDTQLVVTGESLIAELCNPSENRREGAAEQLSTLFGMQPSSVTTQLVPQLLPALAKRLETAKAGYGPVEPSEDIRASCMHLLCKAVQQAPAVLDQHSQAILAMLQHACNDSCQGVCAEACACASALVEHQSGHALYSISRQLVAVFAPLTTHRRQKVRVAAVGAVAALVPCGAGDMILQLAAWQDPNYVPVAAFFETPVRVNYLARLAADRAVAVRLAFLGMLSGWLEALPERADHQGHLLPYILAALTDDCPAVGSAACAALERLGALYEADHEDDLVDPEEDMANAECDKLDAALEKLYVRAGQDPGLHAGMALARPFTERPRLGTRLLVQENLPGMLPGIGNDLTSWVPEGRVRAVGLLQTCLLLAEGGIQKHLAALTPALAKGIMDDSICQSVTSCCEIIAHFVPAEHCSSLLQPDLADSLDSAGKQAEAHEALKAALTSRWHV